MTWPAGDPLLAPVRRARWSGRTRWSLRARLIALSLLVATLALVVVDIVLPTVVASALTSSRDLTLQVAMSSVRPVDTGVLEQMSGTTPLKGGLGLTIVAPSGRTHVVFGTADDGSGPTIPDELSNEPMTVTGPAGTYRMLASAVPSPGGGTSLLVVWTDADDIRGAVSQLIITELLITAGLLLLLGAMASLLIRRELKPLEDMTDVADSIAAGDLSQRVQPHGAGLEVDRLGRAFNGMIDAIDGLIAERENTERRLRQFVADASHELRTPVAAVRGYSDLYAAGALPDQPAVSKAMERMGFEARRMGELVEDLLTLAQADTPDSTVSEPVDLVALLRGTVDDAAAIDASRHWQLILGQESDQPMVLGDGNRLHQLFANLLGNVRTHTPPGTTAAVLVDDSDPTSVRVSIDDNGPGVDPAALPRLFDRFFRADKSRSREMGGSGLGLAIVAAITTAHGGTVTASPSPVGGLRVEVRLPRRSVDNTAAVPPSTSVAAGNRA